MIKMNVIYVGSQIAFFLLIMLVCIERLNNQMLSVKLPFLINNFSVIFELLHDDKPPLIFTFSFWFW